MIAVWSVKGGSGASVFSACLALSLAHEQATTLIDLAGDQGAIFALDDEAELGARQWFHSNAPNDALRRLAVPVTDELQLVPAGAALSPGNDGAAAIGSGQRLADAIGPHDVVDVGIVRHETDVATDLAVRADHSILVVRSCYLAVRRAVALPFRPTGLVVVEEEGRTLDGHDVATVLDVPLVASITADPSLSAAIDAGRIVHKRNRAPKAVQKLAHHLIRTGVLV